MTEPLSATRPEAFPVQPDEPAACGFNPGPRYRRTRYGWEPADAWKPSAAAAIPGEPPAADQLLSLLADTMAAGCSLQSATKWWGYIFDAWRKKERG